MFALFKPVQRWKNPKMFIHHAHVIKFDIHISWVKNFQMTVLATFLAFVLWPCYQHGVLQMAVMVSFF